MNLFDLCCKAWIEGLKFDLSKCRYGFHKRTGVQCGTHEYYYFLAGFAHVIKARNIIEIGTHEGGSAKALAIGAPDARIVTIDRHDNFKLDDLHHAIYRIQGEANDTRTILATLRLMPSAVDFLFIDSSHSFDATIAQYWLYSRCFSPRYVIFDDIRLNPEMVFAWQQISNHAKALDISSMIDRIQGFGVVELRPSMGA